MKSLQEKNIKRVLAKIENQRSKIIDFLRHLVTIPTVAGKEKQGQKFIADKLRKIGLDITMWEPNVKELDKAVVIRPSAKKDQYRDRPNLVGKLKGSGGGKSIILNGHIDVVPTGKKERWTHDPFGGEIEDSKLYGRGSADMKGGLTALIMALQCIKQADVDMKGDVLLESVVDEERGGNGTLSCILKGYTADAAIVAEPTGLEIKISEGGSNYFRIRVYGKSAHSGLAGRGVNAVKKAMKIVYGLDDLQQIRIQNNHNVLYEDYPTVCVGRIRGGNSPFTVCEECIIDGSMEAIPDDNLSKENLGKFKTILEEHISMIARTDPWLSKHPPKIEWPGIFTEPAEIRKDEPIVSTVESSFERVTGLPPKISAFLTGCDMHHLVLQGKIPTLVFGPGKLELAHATDEYIDIDEVVMATKVIAVTLLQWCEA